MKASNKIASHLKSHPIASTISAISLVAIAIFASIGAKGEEVPTIAVRRSDYTNVISVAGKVTAARTANLGFDQNGRIASTYQEVGASVTAGAVIASIDNGALLAEVAQKQAALEREKARLAAAERGTRKEELAIYEQSYADASSALVIAMRNAYLETEGAVINKADVVFENGNTANPTIIVRTQSSPEKQSIEQERLAVAERLRAWKAAMTLLTPASDAAAIRATRATGDAAMAATKSFLDHVAAIANNLTIGNSGLAQATIDSYRASISTAAQAASSAASNEQTAYTAWTSAASSLALQRSGSTNEDIGAQSASVKAAAADLANAKAQLAKSVVTAPFDGIITRMDAKVGEIVSPNEPLISIMSSGAFDIESYIPEIHISHISIGDPAEITLDAYGSDATFSATVASIDPAETVRDGVSTYKTRLRFASEDPRIKSGMTANIRITTDRKTNVILIPKKLVSARDDGTTAVSVLGKDGIVRPIDVRLGSPAGLGQIEVVSGLTEGDLLALPAATP